MNRRLYNKKSAHYYCGCALSLAERDGEHIGSHLWRGVSDAT